MPHQYFLPFRRPAHQYLLPGYLLQAPQLLGCSSFGQYCLLWKLKAAFSPPSWMLQVLPHNLHGLHLLLLHHILFHISYFFITSLFYYFISFIIFSSYLYNKYIISWYITSNIPLIPRHIIIINPAFIPVIILAALPAFCSPANKYISLLFSMF